MYYLLQKIQAFYKSKYPTENMNPLYQPQH
jgi:hypothetical protein